MSRPRRPSSRASQARPGTPQAEDGAAGGIPASAGRAAGKWPRRITAALTATAFGAFLGVAWLSGEIAAIEGSLPATPQAAELARSTVVLDRTGALLRPYTTPEGRWRLPVARDAVDPAFLAMLCAYEDRRFRDHHGVDWRAIGRAAWQLVRSGHIVSGGSTLTMQVARLIEARPTRGLSEKLRQIVHARRLEADLSKDGILDLYLALAPYGGNIEGVRAASLAWFGKEPRRLTLAESALLVALPQAPEARRPDRDPAAAKAARDRVLDRLAAAGAIDAEAAAAAKSERVPAARRDFPLLAAHLGDAARRAQPGAGAIRLTLDARLQARLERLAAERAAAAGPKASVAILVADQTTGEILASVGSAGFTTEGRGGYLDMTRAVRSPGSTLKPLIYGLAFEDGLAHPQSLIEDRPSAFAGYTPVNFDGFYRGTVTVHDALTESLNVPAVAVLDAVGPARLVARLKRAAAAPVLPELSAPGLAVGLGGVGLSLRDLVATYAAIARGGAPVPLVDGSEAAAPVREAAAPPVLDRIAAWYVADILADVPPPANGARGRIAYKTGTSYGYRDAWSIGFDGSVVIGVWVGRPDGAPVTGLTGIGTAAPILFEAFDRLGHEPAPLRPAPAGALIARTGDLPAPLRRFRGRAVLAGKADDLPEIAFPPDGVAIDLGFAAGDPGPLAIKVRNGRPPFVFLANGVPIARSPFARSESYAPEGPGFVTLSVVDADGRSDRVTVFVE
ncbi:penicillin-binding protein 1C [Prosthecomicrobium pneumaticum]|uniref:peptidoglycan glycosyltransferase n=1 Tax=Prosthecomicrobium pneumaticum TaxID=81895 RepID=A0A7W9FKA8_9HYPH|nr:penicillin-binding protein 1C [Prosthecomicrobium pneumaticum]MBB5752350.1 penicillin-binding protein 1C [Prosthecomicrobium pneumaticum]